MMQVLQCSVNGEDTCHLEHIPIERNERGVSMWAFLPEPVADEVSVLMKASDGE